MTSSTDMKIAGGLLALALALGGAGINFPVLQMAVGLAAIASAAYFVLTRRNWHFSPLSRAAIAILVVTLLLPLLQIAPLPPTLWTALPGRALPMEVDAALGQAPWRPTTLDVEGSVRSFIAMIPAAVLFIALLFLSRAERTRLLWVVLGFALLSAAIGIIQATSGGLLTIFPSGHKGFATGLFVNRNHNAALLLVAIPIAAGLAATHLARGKPASFWVVAALSAMILLSLGVLGTTSRMGLALLPLSIGASLILLLFRRAGVRIAAVAVAILGLVTALLAGAGRIDRVLERFSGLDDSRLTFWTDVRWALDYYGLWGTGFGTFDPVFKSAESLDSILPETVNHAHNDFLEIALVGGWPALLLLFAFFVVVLVSAVRGDSSQSRGGRPISTTIALLGIAFFLAASLVDYPLRMTSLSCVLALFVALLLPSPSSPSSKSMAVALPANTSISSRPAAWFAFAVIAVSGFLTIQAGASAFMLQHGRFGAAAAWAPWSTRAQVELASAALIRNDLAGAVAHGERAIALSPISAPAIRSVGLARLAEGRRNQGNRLMQAATVLGWRDPLTQLWAIEAAKASKEPEKAVQRAEALFRQDELVGPATALLLATGVNEQTVPFLAKSMAGNPPWRENFFKAGEGLSPSVAEGWVRLVAALRKTNAPVTQLEGAPSIDALIAAGRLKEAQALWSLLQRDSQLVANGDFQDTFAPRDPTRPVLWHIPTENRQLIRAEDVDGGSSKALHIRGAMEDRLIEQRLLLPAGHYELRFRMRSDQPADVRLQWRLACQKAGPQQRAESIVPARTGWREYRWPFVVPNQDCAIQTLALRRAGATSPEDVWLDSIRLTRTSI